MTQTAPASSAPSPAYAGRPTRFSVKALLRRALRRTTPASADNGPRFGDEPLDIASDPNASPAALATLAADASDAVRMIVAHNERTPPGTLVELAADASAAVRAFVAQNPSSPAAALATLAGDRTGSIRRIVAARDDLTDNIRTILALAGGDR